MRKPIVIGNWKLNGTKAITRELVTQLASLLPTTLFCEIGLAPPAVYLESAYQLLGEVSSAIRVVAQDVDIHEKGAHTGELAAVMLRDVGAHWVIVGHSERRSEHQESDQRVAEKFLAVLTAGLSPVLCIGETEAEHLLGKTEQVCARQLDAVIELVGINGFDGAIIAYEPVWAIGTGKSATPEQAQHVHQHIRAHLARHGAAIAQKIILQYGGSVNPGNAAGLFAMPDIDGALVGGASLNVDQFSTIVKAAASVKESLQSH